MATDSSDLRNRLWALAATQSGYFTSSQALKLGYSYPQHTFHTKRGNWIRVEPKIYRLPHFPIGPHDDLVRASLWTMRKGTTVGVISHESAGAVLGLGELDPIRTHVTVPATFRSEHPAVVLHKADLPDEDIEEREGFRITTPGRTLVDIASSGTDPDQLDRALSDAFEQHLVTPRMIRLVADRVGGRGALEVERSLGRVIR